MKSIGLLGGKKTLTQPTLNEVICFHGVTGALYFPSSLKKLTTFRYIQRSRDEIYLVRVNQFQWKKKLVFPLWPLFTSSDIIYILSRALNISSECIYTDKQMPVRPCLAVSLLPGWFGLLLLSEIKPRHSSGNGCLQELIWCLRFGSLCDSQSWRPTPNLPQEVFHLWMFPDALLCIHHRSHLCPMPYKQHWWTAHAAWSQEQGLTAVLCEKHGHSLSLWDK